MDTSVNPEDEWPEEDVKPKKGKKAKKGKKVEEDEGMDLDAAPTSPPPESIPQPEAESAPADTTVHVDDEWPEEEVKPKKGKAGKKGKKTVDNNVDDEAIVLEEKKAAVETVPVSSEPVKEEEMEVVEPEANGEAEEDGPKVCMINPPDFCAYTLLDLDESTKREAEEGEREGEEESSISIKEGAFSHYRAHRRGRRTGNSHRDRRGRGG